MPCNPQVSLSEFRSIVRRVADCDFPLASNVNVKTDPLVQILSRKFERKPGSNCEMYLVSEREEVVEYWPGDKAVSLEQIDRQLKKYL